MEADKAQLLAPGERPDWLYQWIVTYPPSMRKRLTNFPYTRQEAEAKFGPGWCEPDIATGTRGKAEGDPVSWHSRATR